MYHGKFFISFPMAVDKLVCLLLKNESISCLRDSLTGRESVMGTTATMPLADHESHSKPELFCNQYFFTVIIRRMCTCDAGGASGGASGGAAACAGGGASRSVRSISSCASSCSTS